MTDAEIRQLTEREGALVGKSLPAHLFMPADGIVFDKQGYITLPAVGATASIVSFTVPEGMHGVVNRLGNVYVGTGFIEGTGQLVWQVVANDVVIRNYDNIQASLGSVNQPSQLTGSGILVKEQQLVKLTLKNVSLVVGGSVAMGRLGGYFYPKDHEPDSMWL